MPIYKHCIFLITLSLSIALVAYSEIIEFEKFVSPDGPWGRQPILLDEDGGFSNILVAIHADVKESEIDLETITVSTMKTHSNYRTINLERGNI